MSQVFSDSNLQVTTIDDFTPGIVQPGVRTNVVTYSTTSPLGSASTAVRCIGVKNVGLWPLPSYNTIFDQKNLSILAGGTAVVGDMVCLGPTANFGFSGSTSDSLVYSIITYDSATPTGQFAVYRICNGVSNQVYTVSQATAPSIWYPNLAMAAFNSSGSVFQQGVVGLSPIIVGGNLGAVIVPNWNSNADSGTVLVSATNVGFKTFVTNSRVCFILDTSIKTATDTYVQHLDVIYDTDLQAMTNITGPNLFYPEIGSEIGAWGSMSAGELLIVFASGGGVVIYGDIGVPQSSTRLPGVVGTGSAIGPACQSPAGLIYTTSFDGVYLWNGSNVSQKISPQIPDAAFTRKDITAPWSPGYDRILSGCNTSSKAWNNWVMFPNNWLFDCITSSWWLCEDPNIINFQSHAPSCISPQLFYSSNGYAQILSAGGTLNTTFYQWNSLTLQSSYSWTSNPIPVSIGSLTTLAYVEIVASNISATPCTVTITPTSPPGQSTFPNNSQSIPFTIPPNTASYRAGDRLGYTDYNIEIKVDAVNSNTSNAAPVIHTIHLGFTPTRPSGIR